MLYRLVMEKLIIHLESRKIPRPFVWHNAFCYRLRQSRPTANPAVADQRPTDVPQEVGGDAGGFKQRPSLQLSRDISNDYLAADND